MHNTTHHVTRDEVCPVVSEGVQMVSETLISRVQNTDSGISGWGRILRSHDSEGPVLDITRSGGLDGVVIHNDMSKD